MPAPSSRWAFLLAMVLLASAGATPRALALSTRAPETPLPVGQIRTTAQTACCGGGAPNFGNQIDFAPIEEGTPITDQYGSMDILFGTAATPLAAETVVQIDYSIQDPPNCRNVLNGDPPFQGWEFFIFADEATHRWAKAQRVGAQIGYCDRANTVFIAAYDANDNLLQVRFNDIVGYQFLSIQRPTADICKVLIGDCAGGGGACSPDPGGSGLNCLTFSTPVPTTFALPDTVSVPPGPLIQGTPGVGGLGLVALAALMAIFAIVSVSRNRVAVNPRG